MLWFDAHLDLAYIALCGRNMDAADPATAGGPDAPGGITLPSLRDGGVAGMLATIFIEPDGKPEQTAYRSGDPESARAAALRQTALYRSWADQGRCTLMTRRLYEPEAQARASSSSASPSRPALGILMEGADEIRDASDVQFWVDQGVIAVGLAWAKGTRHAGGNTNDNPLSDSGRAVSRELARLGVIQDLTHLSDRALVSVLEETSGPVIASHSNCRALVDVPGGEVRQRHLTDDVIKEVSRRGGMLGLNIFSPFIIQNAKRDRRATIAEWVAHVDRICDIAGNRTCVGLGSDADGGFSALMQPEGVDRPAHYIRLAEGLRNAGWNDDSIHAFAWQNWANFWGISAKN